MKIKKIEFDSGFKEALPTDKKIQRASLTTPIEDKVTISSKPSFTGNILQFVPNKHALDVLSKWDALRGELGGIILTAIGTGLVAPFSIAFNPFMRAPKGATEEQKKDVSDTKKYSAMRQPVSAVTALACQIPIQKYIDNFLDRMLNVEDAARNFSTLMDRSVLNTDSYLKSQAEKELKKQGVKKPSLLNVKERKVYDARVDKIVSEESNRQFEELVEKFAKDGDIAVSGKKVSYSTLAEIINKHAENYMNKAKELEVDAKGRAFYIKRADTLINNEAHLRDIFGKFNEFERNEEGYQKLNQYLNDLLQKEKSDDVKVLIREVLNLDDDLKASKMESTLNRIKSIKDLCTEEVIQNGKSEKVAAFSQSKYHDVLLRRNSTLERIRTKIQMVIDKNNPETATKESIQEIIEELKDACKFKKDNVHVNSILHDSNTFNFDGEKLLKKIQKDIIKGYKTLSDDRVKCYNMTLKILTGIFTMIISCDVLNWVYPRFMEIFFPRLSGVKKAKDEGGVK